MSIEVDNGGLFPPPVSTRKRMRNSATMLRQYLEMREAMAFFGLTYIAENMRLITVQYREGEVIYSYSGNNIAFKE